MKKIFFKAGIIQLLTLLGLHLYNNRHGLPIPVKDEDSRKLTELMKDYPIHYSDLGKPHTLDQTIWGYDLTWASFVLFAFLISFVALKYKFNSPKPGRYVALCQSVLWGAAFIAAWYFWSPPQQIIFGLLFLTFFTSYFFEWRNPTPKKTKICVVGAGISGLTAAYQLQKLGYHNVTLVEKAPQVGGKCHSNVYDHVAFDLGGHEMLAGYSDVMNIAKELGAPDKLSIPPLVYDRTTRKYLNFKQSATASESYSLMQVMWASIRYYFMVVFRYRTISQPSTGLKNCPPDLYKPLDQWLEEKNLKPLEGILNFVVKIQGYGQFKSSAAYFVKFMGARNWFSLLISGMGLSKKWPRVFTYGMLNLCERMAATVLDVRTSTNIVKIRRDNSQKEGGVTVYFEGKSEPESFDKLIMSTSLEIGDLPFLDLTDQESALFEKIQHVRAFGTLGVVQGLPAGVVGTVPLNDINQGEYTGYIKDYTDEPIALFFTIAKDESIDGKKVVEEINRVLDNNVPHMNGIKPQFDKVLDQRLWKYFPFVSPDIFATGFFDKLESLQGDNHTFYASSLLSFECVGNSVAYSKRMVEDHF